MPQQTDKYSETIQILAEPEMKIQVAQLAGAHGMKIGPYIRRLITAAYRHEYENRPMCANGSDCRCTNLHTVRSPIDPMPEAG